MGFVYLKIRSGVAKLEEVYITGRIRAILGESGAEDATVTGSFIHDYVITGIPDGADEAVLSMMMGEPGFEPLVCDD